MSGSLEGNLEENVLTILCWDSINSPTVALQLQPSIFSTRTYRKIAEVAFAHIERYGQPPGAHLHDLLESDMRRGDEGILIGKTIDAMRALAPQLQAQYVLDQLGHFIDRRKMLIRLEAAADEAHAGNLDAAREHLADTGPTDNAFDKGIWLDDTDAMLGFLDNQEDDKFPIGIEEFDKRGVQPARGTLTLLVAPPKKGKSWFLINCGKTALQYKKKVLHITLENSAKLTAKRYVQALFGYKQTEATTVKIAEFLRDTSGRWTDIQKPEALRNEPHAITAAHKGAAAKKLKALARRGKLRIEHFPSGTFTIAMYNALLDKLKRADGFEPDVVVLDYPDLMAQDKELRQSLGQTFVRLRGVAEQRGHALIAATQGNREAATAKTVGTTMVAEDFSKIATADLVITYSQTAKEKRAGLARLFVPAARDAADGFVILITQAYAIGQFCLDSVYFDEHVEEAIERVAMEASGGN